MILVLGQLGQHCKFKTSLSYLGRLCQTKPNHQLAYGITDKLHIIQIYVGWGQRGSVCVESWLHS